jgi:hypothetical protein
VDVLAYQSQHGLCTAQSFHNIRHGISKAEIKAVHGEGQTQQSAAVAVMQGTIRPARLRRVAGHGSIADLPGGGCFVGFGHWFPPGVGCVWVVWKGVETKSTHKTQRKILFLSFFFLFIYILYINKYSVLEGVEVWKKNYVSI